MRSREASSGVCFSYSLPPTTDVMLSLPPPPPSLLLDGERWKQAEVPVEVQALVQRLETGQKKIGVS